MLSLKENGELIKLRNKWWYDKAECSLSKDNQEASHNELTLSNVAGIFYILIGGLLVSVFVAMIEFCFRNKANRAAAAAAAHGGMSMGGVGGGSAGGKSNGSMLLGPANVGVGPGVVASTHQRNALAESMHHAKAKLTIQASRDYDNGRVGVSIVKGCKGWWVEEGVGVFSQGLQMCVCVI